MVSPQLYIWHVNHTDSWTVRLSVHSLTCTIREPVPSFFWSKFGFLLIRGGRVWHFQRLSKYKAHKKQSDGHEYFRPWGRKKHWLSQPIYRYSHFTEMNFEASYTQNFRVTEVWIISSVNIYAMRVTPSTFTKGRGPKKIDFFLGKSPKLWVGGGQES